jgi:hypothetical protein
MTKPAHVADFERLEDEIDDALLKCPPDGRMSAELRRRQLHLKEEIERLRHEPIGRKIFH